MMSWRELRSRYERLLEEYGAAAVAVYFTLFFGTLFGFWIAITYGFEPEGWVAGTGTIGGAYLATKLTQPIRIGATLLLTPLVVSAWRRLRGQPATAAPSPEDRPSTEPPSLG
jgi:hypothetical protein